MVPFMSCVNRISTDVQKISKEAEGITIQKIIICNNFQITEQDSM